MLISPRNTLTDTPRNYALPALWVSFSPVKLTHKINHHSWLPLNTSIRFRCWWTSKKDEAGSSLAAQGLGIHTSIAGAQIRSLVGELRSHTPLAGPKKKKTKQTFILDPSKTLGHLPGPRTTSSSSPKAPALEVSWPLVKVKNKSLSLHPTSCWLSPPLLPRKVLCFPQRTAGSSPW